MERIVPSKSTRIKKNRQPPLRTGVSEASMGYIIYCRDLFGKLFY